MKLSPKQQVILKSTIYQYVKKTKELFGARGQDIENGVGMFIENASLNLHPREIHLVFAGVMMNMDGMHAGLFVDISDMSTEEFNETIASLKV